jgi:hypothetical protein
VAAGLLALIGWQAGPYLFPKAASPAAETQTPAETAKSAAPARTAETKPAPTQAAPAPTATQPAEEHKPSPMPPAPSTKLPETATERPKSVRVAAGPQPVSIITSPAGATATLDGRPDTSCMTPCSIDAMPGRHNIAVALSGFHSEIREVDVGTAPVEMPVFVMRAPGGTLMLTSDPTGAAVLVDGKRIDKTTPAQIQLPFGSHNVTVEKDGHQVSQKVDVNTSLTTLKILLGQ